MKSFSGPVLFLDRSNINTDEIIPAKYLTEVKKEALKPFLLEDLKLEGFIPDGPWRGSARVVVTRENFGCGSSREHAPWALEVNEITVIIAESYARIFRQNMFNGGMLAIELSKDDINSIFTLVSEQEVFAKVDLDKKTLTFTSGTSAKVVAFSVSEFDEALVRSGGWVEFADARY